MSNTKTDKAPASVEELHELFLKQSAAQDEKIAALTKENTELRGILIQGNAEEKKPEIPKEPVSIDGKKYAFNLAHFTLPGDTEAGVEPLYVKAEEAALDEEILARILSIKGQGILKEIV